MEVDAVRRGQVYPPGLGTPRGRRVPVGATEGPRERLVRRIAGLDGDVENPQLALEQAERRALEKDPPPQPSGRLAGRRGHDSVEL